jgi:hypothetical protein
MKRHLYLLWLDILFALPVLVFYLLWDMREIERDLTTARHLVLATALAVLVGLPLRFLYHHLPFRVAEVYARAVWLSAGILMYSGWVGPSMLAVLATSPFVAMRLAHFTYFDRTWLVLNAYYFVTLSVFSGIGVHRDAQVIANNVCGLMLIVISFGKALRKVFARLQGEDAARDQQHTKQFA